MGVRVHRRFFFGTVFASVRRTPRFHFIKISASFHIPLPSYDSSSYMCLFCNAILGQPCSLGCLIYHQIQDSIKATKSKVTSKLASSRCEITELKILCQDANAPKLSQRIKKNAIIAKYDEDCHKKDIQDKPLQLKKVSLPIYQPPIQPSSYLSATA